MTRRNRNRNRNRNHGTQQRGNSGSAAATTFGSPNANKKGLIESIGGLLVGASSYKGAFWFGIGLATVSFVKNVAFYISVGVGVMGMAPIAAGVLGLGFAVATTFCEVYNLSQGTSGTLALARHFKIASRPDRLPQISKTQYHDPEEPGDRYRKTIDGMESLMGPLGWACFGVEVLTGIAFLMGADPGIEAIMELGGFIFSIVGTVGGILLALKSYDMHLPAMAREQMSEMANANRRLKI
jgi:hypothetical protein